VVIKQGEKQYGDRRLFKCGQAYYLANKKKFLEHGVANALDEAERPGEPVKYATEQQVSYQQWHVVHVRWSKTLDNTFTY
jgi:hypothetical protein